MTRCSNPNCSCQPDRRNIWCKLGFHDYHNIGGHALCVRPKCDMMDLGVGECHAPEYTHLKEESKT